MDDHPATGIRQRGSAYYTLWLLIGAAVLAALGILSGHFLAQTRDARVQLTMVCVSGFSWDRIIPLQRGGRLPFLARLFRSRGTCGDSISYTSDTDPAIVASLFTGRFPATHAMYREADLMRFIAPGEFQKPVWEELIEHRQQCVVAGLPCTQSSSISASRENTKNVAPPVIRGHLQRIMRGMQVPANLLPLLRECVSSDLERMQQAVTARAANPELHLFAYFQGLGRWQQRLTEDNGAIPDALRAALIDNYYIFFDRILSLLYSQCTNNGVFMVLSEHGNINGHPAYASSTPHLPRYPAIGFFYATGLHIRAGIAPLNIAPVDVVPTLLFLAGIATAEPLDGRVMFNLLEEHYYFQRKIISDTQ
jgi:hypothetical protein